MESIKEENTKIYKTSVHKKVYQYLKQQAKDENPTILYNRNEKIYLNLEDKERYYKDFNIESDKLNFETIYKTWKEREQIRIEELEEIKQIIKPFEDKLMYLKFEKGKLKNKKRYNNNKKKDLLTNPESAYNDSDKKIILEEIDKKLEDVTRGILTLREAVKKTKDKIRNEKFRIRDLTRRNKGANERKEAREKKEEQELTEVRKAKEKKKYINQFINKKRIMKYGISEEEKNVTNRDVSKETKNAILKIRLKNNCSLLEASNLFFYGFVEFMKEQEEQQQEEEIQKVQAN